MVAIMVAAVSQCDQSARSRASLNHGANKYVFMSNLPSHHAWTRAGMHCQTSDEIYRLTRKVIQFM